MCAMVTLFEHWMIGLWPSESSVPEWGIQESRNQHLTHGLCINWMAVKWIHG